MNPIPHAGNAAPSAVAAERYDGPSILLHWLTAVLVLLLFGLACTWNYVVPHDHYWRPLLETTHVSLGILFAAVFAARVLWRLSAGRRLPPHGSRTGRMSRSNLGRPDAFALTAPHAFARVAPEGPVPAGRHSPARNEKNGKHHMTFFDFRTWPAEGRARTRASKALGRHAGAILVAAVAAASALPAAADDAGKPEAGKSASFVDNFDAFDTKRWYVSNGWTNGPHQNCTWSKQELKLTKGILYLHFDKKKFKDRDYSCGETHTKKVYSYGTYEARMKTDVGSGLNAAFFTYVGPTEKKPHDEIDFEVLTKNPNKVQVNVFADGKGHNEKMVDVKGGSNNGFHDYAFVWEPKSLRWYVDGKLVNTITDPAKIPTTPQHIFFSLWGTDTLSAWMGKFEDPGRQVTLAVDRVAYTALGDKCQFEDSVACKLK